MESIDQVNYIDQTTRIIWHSQSQQIGHSMKIQSRQGG